MGRPTKYSAQCAGEICKRLAQGLSLSKVCLDSGLPSRDTVYKWLTEHADFSDNYTRARELYADRVFDELLDICDDEDLKPQDVQKAKLQIDTRKWMLARMSPRKYGDRSALEVSGEGGGPISVTYDKMFEGM